MFKKPGGCPHCGDKKFNKVKFADSERKFPIDTPENIKQTWNTLHDKKNKSKYSKDVFKTLEEKIINAWIHHIGYDVPVPTAQED